MVTANAKKERMKEEDKEDMEKKTPLPEEDEKCTKKADEEDVEKKEDDEEDEEEAKKKKAMKGKDGGKAPQESEAESAGAEGSISPNMGVPSTQNVFTPQSNINVSREQVTPMGKSFEVDLTKSPLFVSISKQMDGLQTAINQKVDALEKSLNDRLKNIKTDMEKIEKFYGQSMYKSVNDKDNGAEGIATQGISKQLEEGKVRFSAR